MVKQAGRCCPIDPGHTPRLWFEKKQDFEYIVNILDESLSLTEKLEIGEFHLEVGTQLLCAEGEGFFLDGEMVEPFDPPFSLDGLLRLADLGQFPLQLTFRRPSSVLEKRLPPVSCNANDRVARANCLMHACGTMIPARDSSCRMMDPADGCQLVYIELRKKYCQRYSEEQIKHYWRDQCIPVPHGHCGVCGFSNDATDSGSPAAFRSAPDEWELVS